MLSVIVDTRALKRIQNYSFVMSTDNTNSVHLDHEIWSQGWAHQFAEEDCLLFVLTNLRWFKHVLKEFERNLKYLLQSDFYVVSISLLTALTHQQDSKTHDSKNCACAVQSYLVWKLTRTNYAVYNLS